MNIFRSLTVRGWEGGIGPLDQKGKRTSPNSERKEAVGALINIRRSPQWTDTPLYYDSR